MTTNNDLLHIEAVREKGFILYAKDGELKAKKHLSLEQSH